jgi:hypothetical protein
MQSADIAPYSLYPSLPVLLLLLLLFSWTNREKETELAARLIMQTARFKNV